MKYRLFNRDPYSGLRNYPHLLGYNPLYNPVFSIASKGPLGLLESRRGPPWSETTYGVRIKCPKIYPKIHGVSLGVKFMGFSL